MDPYREPAPHEARPPRAPRLAFPPVWLPMERTDEVLLVWLGSLTLAMLLATCGH
ncbi:MAG TPA: hypothetical protein VIF09_28900 [Polyangiaceae bacterium]|jgi:hypothetical protein